MIPETIKQYKVKNPDAIVDGVTLDFKTVTGGEDAISRNIHKSAQQAHDVFLKLTQTFTLSRVKEKVGEGLSSSNRKGTDGIVYVQLADGSFHEWNMDEFE